MKVHVLAGSGSNGTYQIVTHQATPNGTGNSAGFAWAAVRVAAKLNKSVLTVGTGAGQTTQAEIDAIVAGTVMEGTFAFDAPSSLTPAQLATLLDAQATVILAAQSAEFQKAYKWYGATRA